MENTFPPRPSNTITPKHRRIYIEEVPSNHHSRLSRERINEGNQPESHEDPHQNFDHREKRLDDHFKSILDRTNRSREYIENLDKQKSQEITRESINIRSPPSTALQFKSPNSTTSLGGTRQFANYEQEPNSNFKSTKTTDFEPVKYEHSAEDYARLENELSELKRTVMTKLRAKEARDEQEKKASVKERTTKSKPKAELMIETSEESDEPETTRVDKQKTVTSTKGHQTIRSAKSPYLSSVVSPKSTKRVLSPNPTTLRVGKKKEKTVHDLQEELKEKEKVDHEKYVNLKLKCKEFKEILREYLQKNNELQESNDIKDQLVQELEIQLQKSNAENLRQAEIIQELRKRDEQLSRSEEESRTASREYRSRLADQKQVLTKIEESIRDNEEKYRSQLEKLIIENQQLKHDLAEALERETSSRNKSEILTKEVAGFRLELEAKQNIVSKLDEQVLLRDNEVKQYREQFEKLTQTNRELLDQLEQGNETLNQLDAKLSNFRKKADEDKNRAVEERDQDISQKKEKIKILKDQIKDLESLYNKLLDEKRAVNHELERTISEKSELQRENERLSKENHEIRTELETSRKNCDSLKNQNEDIFKSFQLENAKSQELTADIKRDSAALKRAEEKILLREKENTLLEEAKKKAEADLKEATEELSKSQEIIYNLEGQLKYFQVKQNEDLQKVEAKLDRFAEEMHIAREENIALKSRESQYISQLQTLSEDKERYRKEYKQYKDHSKGLEKKVNELQAHLEQILTEKIFQIEESTREAQIEKEKQSKIKFLDNVQEMIRNFRSEQSAYKALKIEESAKK